MEMPQATASLCGITALNRSPAEHFRLYLKRQQSFRSHHLPRRHLCPNRLFAILP